MKTEKTKMDYTYTQNRDLSWLKFNERVLDEANDASVPILERMKFAAIFTSNLDEFFMIRVGSLHDLSMLKNIPIDNKSGLDPKQQLEAIYEAVRPLYKKRDRYMRTIKEDLETHGIQRLLLPDLSGKDKKFVRQYFLNQVMPILSPQIIDIHHPFPHLENKMLYIALNLKTPKGILSGMIPVPKTIKRVLRLPGSSLRYVLLEDIILHYVQEVFDMYEVVESAVVSVTRNADIQPDDEAFEVDEDFRNHMKKIVKLRSRLAPVRLEMQGPGNDVLADFLCERLQIDPRQVYVGTAPLDLSYAFEMESKMEPSQAAPLIHKPFKPQYSPDVIPDVSMMKQVQKRDILLHYPYDSMDSVLELVKEASRDPHVLSIKITLYRIDNNSRLARYLIDAVENGKEVITVMELRARFDELNNIEWAEQLEEAGCTVVYGFEKYKIHSKACLITRMEKNKLTYITHIGTGNFNEKTAKLYTDLALLTSDKEIGLDANKFFKRVLLSSLEGEYDNLLVSPFELKDPVINLIKGETDKAKVGKQSGIFMKMNSLTDREIIDALVEASQVGVPIRLIIRGICCLLPGIPGKTDFVEVHSVVGRFLEHSRVFSFGSGNDSEVYISSADLMTRNTVKRVEIACPVKNSELKKRILDMMELQFSDNVKARKIDSNGDYIPIFAGSESPINSQQQLMDMALNRQIKERSRKKGSLLRVLPILLRRSLKRKA